MKKIATKVIHEGYTPEPLAGCVSPPVYLSTTYIQDGVGNFKDHDYCRTSHPNRNMVEDNITALEEAYGTAGFASGMAAISTLILTLKASDHVIVSGNVYGGTYRVFTKVFEKFDIKFSFVDTTDLKNVEDAILDNTKLIYVETPTNPLMDITDIKAIADLAHSKNLKLCVDNTFMTPIFQKPMTLGADYIIHSATKYLGGHSDVLGGFLCCANKEDLEEVKFIQNSCGAVLSAFDSWLILRGIKTLSVRMMAHQQNAIKVAEMLENHPKVAKVFYPGIKSHVNYDIGVSQTSGFGGMLSFELKSGTPENFLKELKVFTLAESLGAVESLVCIPALMTHASVPKEQREILGIADGLIRLSVGIEDTEDILEDLKRAIDCA
ncbi:MAG: PLP-dependent transferase [Candidatus Cloacimonetes bacterium]|nr:PLP-dependent transferase [Candidatus Cloacimonadota bacterium]